MTIDLALVPAIYELDMRNKAAEAVIKTVAMKHAGWDAAGGVIGALIPVPGMAVATVVAQLIYQAGYVYPELIRRLEVIYGAERDDFTRSVTRTATILETGVNALVASAGPVVLGSLAIDLVNDFGSEFLQEIAWDLAKEAGVGTVLSSIPLFGVAAAAVLDATMAITMTWRVGAVVSAYFQHGGYVSSRRHTYDLVKQSGVSYSTDATWAGTLTKLRKDIAAIRQKQVTFVREQFKALRGTLTIAQIRDLLINKHGIPADIVNPGTPSD